MKRILPLLFLLILTACSGGDRDSSLTQKIRGEGNRSLILTAGPGKVWVGVPFTLTLDMKGEKEDDVLFPKIDQDFLPQGLLLKSFKADDNRLVLAVTGEKTGDYAIPPINVLFANGRGDVELLTRPVNFSVMTLLSEGEGEMAGLSSSLRIGFLTTPWVFGLSGALLLGALIAIWLIIRHKRKTLIPPEPVWVSLERDMEALKGDDSLLAGNLDKFYDLTTGLVRKTLDRVYGESTGEKTREEFIGPLVSSPLYGSETKAWFVKFFERADMVRFARFEADRETALRDLDETLRFAAKGAEKAKSEEEDKS